MGKARESWTGGWLELAEIWHKDPCTDGSDDSCGRFMRSRHGDKKTLAAIESRMRIDWKHWFSESGDQLMSTPGIALQMFWIGAWEFFGSKNSKRATRWMRRNLYDILQFSENPIDGLHDSITGKYGQDREAMEGRVHSFALIIHGWLLRDNRPWWKSPSFHVHHYRINIPLFRSLRRLLWDRCCQCGKTLGWNKSVSSDWNGTRLTCWKCSAAQSASYSK